MSRVDASAWLEHLDRARAVALAGKDPEGVHQVRVAARRLRVWLTLGGREALQDELRWLCRALSEERDLDVLEEVLAGPGLLPLRAQARAHVREALESQRYTALREALGAVKAPKRKKAARAAAKLERAVERRRRATRSQVSAVARRPQQHDTDAAGLAAVPEVPRASLDALHALRRALRRARYAREWLGEGAKALAAEQEQLGIVCDLCALRRLLERYAPSAVPQVEVGLSRALALLG